MTDPLLSDALLSDPLLADPLLADLRGLAVAAPATLADGLIDRWTTRDSVVGPVLVAWTRDGVRFVRAAGPGTDATDDGADGALEAYRQRFGRPLRPADDPPAGLDDALAGRAGATPALDLRGLSAFEHDVLAATRTIPAGETRPYAWVAREVGRPGAVRAAGSVLARNPVPLLIPCHRVVRSDGSTGQYLFGAARKQALLRAEGGAGG